MLAIALIALWVLVWGAIGFFIGRAIALHIRKKRMISDYMTQQFQIYQWQQKCAKNSEEFREAWNNIFPEQKVD